MPHDLKAINAAIRLGDRPRFPAGTKIYRPNNSEQGFAILTALERENPSRLATIFSDRTPCRWVSGDRSGRIEVDAQELPGWRAEVIEVPEDAPPFEEWDRPIPLDEQGRVPFEAAIDEWGEE